MAFMNWLTKKINKVTRFSRANHPLNRNRHLPRQRKQSTIAPNEPEPVQEEVLTESSTPAADHSTIIHQSHKTTSVSFFYLDENGNQLAEPDIFMGESGKLFQFKIPHFDNYYLHTIDNFTNSFADFDQKAVFHFNLKMAAPVKVYSIDIDTSQMLIPVKLVTGKLGQTYQIEPPKINNYRPINSIGKKYGYFSQTTSDVDFYYRKADWSTVQPIDYYIKLNAAHDVFDEPNGKPLTTQLPRSIIVKVFLKIELDDHQTWYNVGGTQWISGDKVELSDPPADREIKHQTKVNESLSMLSGYIDFLEGKSVSTYDKPYGKSLNKLDNGSEVKIQSTLTDDQQIKWYELEDHSVVPARYVVLT
ncbi:MucBP domain-containing protein [Lentilactobacillus sp. Marseille-Q4993]|uniref:MucBP domain-containing protein n=1 Tax=Lentilactobacillus sp. Marseille-Q4993 TaxID=3039492 RepID=UPI0024BCA8FF|nr:MucBP domain-containing protein [Lentilactobacillus sp. Marseille-Q4993]